MAQRLGNPLNGRPLWIMGFLAWALAVAFGFHQAMGWEARAGLPARTLHAQISRARELRLVVVLHSQCPCSLATIRNLKLLRQSEKSRIQLSLVFTGPDPMNSRTWAESTELAPATREILGERQVLAKYGARTSGQAFLYSQNGRLVFSGGLTSSRGIEGESTGLDAIRDALAGRTCAQSAPVFGCSLQTL